MEGYKGFNGKNNYGVSNSGNYNSGDRNSGDYNSGDGNSGDYNSGDGNSGYGNSGDRNSRYGNSGHGNSGDRNSGHGNSGDRNSGDRNSGHGNSGHGNSGDRNSGHGNSGDFNSCNASSGVFMSRRVSYEAFNKSLSRAEFKALIYSEGYRICNNFRLLKCGRKSPLTGKRTYHYADYKTSWQYFWNNLTFAERVAIRRMPHFDRDVFFEITGIKA